MNKYTYFFVSQVHQVEVNDFSTQQLEIAIIIITIIDTHLTVFITLSIHESAIIDNVIVCICLYFICHDLI